jgi:hypothetical protein
MNFGGRLDKGLTGLASHFASYGAEREERILIGVSVLLGLLFFAAYLIIELIYRFIV